MYRLGEMSDTQRVRLGSTLLVAGTVLLAFFVVFLHYSSLPAEEFVDGTWVPVVVDYFNWIPRGWLPKGLSYLLIFGSSQLMVAGAALLWLLNVKMTWARAAFAAVLTWTEFVILWGIVPSEWLNFSQTDLDWSPTKQAFALPTWLMLGNEVSVSLSVLKDAISGGYYMVTIGLAIVFGYKIQGIHTDRPKEPTAEELVSPYGRPLVRGEG